MISIKRTHCFYLACFFLTLLLTFIFKPTTSFYAGFVLFALDFALLFLLIKILFSTVSKELVLSWTKKQRWVYRVGGICLFLSKAVFLVLAVFLIKKNHGNFFAAMQQFMLLFNKINRGILKTHV